MSLGGVKKRKCELTLMCQTKKESKRKAISYYNCITFYDRLFFHTFYLPSTALILGGHYSPRPYPLCPDDCNFPTKPSL